MAASRCASAAGGSAWRCGSARGQRGARLPAAGRRRRRRSSCRPRRRKRTRPRLAVAHQQGRPHAPTSSAPSTSASSTGPSPARSCARRWPRDTLALELDLARPAVAGTPAPRRRRRADAAARRCDERLATPDRRRLHARRGAGRPAPGDAGADADGAGRRAGDGLEAATRRSSCCAARRAARSRRVVSLETPEQQMAALMPRDAAQAERLLAQTLEQLRASGTRPPVLRAWPRPGSAATWRRSSDYERWCECADDRRRPRACCSAERRAQPGDGRRASRRCTARASACSPPSARCT